MKYFVYFDAYGHPRQAIEARELARKYNNDPDVFLRAACRPEAHSAPGPISGHVGVLHFADETEMQRFFDALGDEISGFFDAGSLYETNIGWSETLMDAGLGVRIHGMFPWFSSYTLRFDFPLWLSHPASGDDNTQFRWLFSFSQAL